MRVIRGSSKQRGIALIIVMIVIFVLAILAGGFAYSMKVETKLARNNTYNSDLELIGRSGVEWARWILAQELRSAEGTYTALNQKWNDGFTTNEILMDIELKGVKLGAGMFSVRMIDMERKINLSSIFEGNIEVFQRALQTIGVDATELTPISDAFLDWIDNDENHRINGAESEYYLKAIPGKPHYAKNGRVDDISELLMIKGITPEIYWGSGRTGVPLGMQQALRQTQANTAFLSGSTQAGSSSVGLVDLFVPFHAGGVAVNVNTASADVLAALPGMDLSLAQAIVTTRAGSDGVDGTDDDTPFVTPGELASVPGIDPAVLNVARQYLTTRSFLFQVIVDAEIGTMRRTYVALVHRRNQQDIPILYFQWK